MKKAIFVKGLLAAFGLFLTGCGNGNNPVDLDPCEQGRHDWNEYVQITAPTCEDAGVKERTCKDCYAVDAETVEGEPALGHSNMIDTTVQREATCVDTGVMNTKCEREQCTHTSTRAIDIDNNAHTMSGFVLTDTTYPATLTGTCIRCPATGTRVLAIGDKGPGGGTIVYVAGEDGFTVEGYGKPEDTGYFESYTAYYLEAAPSDSGGYGAWSNGYGGTMQLPHIPLPPYYNQHYWGNTVVGRGRRNTQVIVAYMRDTTHERDRAAQKATAANFGGQNDWFLPSLGELAWLGVERRHLGGFGGMYWSSSWDDLWGRLGVWVIRFYTDGGSLSYVEDPLWGAVPGYSIYVRAVRAF